MTRDPQRPAVAHGAGGRLWSRRRVLGVGALGLVGLGTLARLAPDPIDAAGGSTVAAADGTAPNLVANPSFEAGEIGRTVLAWSIS